MKTIFFASLFLVLVGCSSSVTTQRDNASISFGKIYHSRILKVEEVVTDSGTFILADTPVIKNGISCTIVPYNGIWLFDFDGNVGRKIPILFIDSDKSDMFLTRSW